MARAATAAIAEAAAMAQREGRRDIAAAGFGKKWQNALRSRVYPPQGASMRPAALIYHRIPYSAVFEEGAVIRGKPYMWLPLPGVSVRSGGRGLTPAQYARAVGPLVVVSRPGQAPLLFPKYRANGQRRRPGTGTRDQRKPLYVGVAIAFIDKRFDIRGIVQSAADKLPALYDKHFRAD
jgi:hypothetical protein